MNHVVLTPLLTAFLGGLAYLLRLLVAEGDLPSPRRLIGLVGLSCIIAPIITTLLQEYSHVAPTSAMCLGIVASGLGPSLWLDLATSIVKKLGENASAKLSQVVDKESKNG